MSAKLLLISFVLFLFLSCDEKQGNNLTLVQKKIRTEKSTNPIYNEGKELYKIHCAACHQFKKIGTHMGPSLNTLGELKDSTLIREAVIEPNRTIAKGYKANVMPDDFGKKLSENEMDSLIFYLTN